MARSTRGWNFLLTWIATMTLYTINCTKEVDPLSKDSNHSYIYKGTESDLQRWLALRRSLSTISSGKKIEYHFVKEMSAWAAEKARFVEMPFKTKRQYYRSKAYVELNQIPSWKSYYLKNEERLKNKLKENEKVKKYSPDEQLNDIVTLWQGDITQLEIDAIVNAANTGLLGGGGVDGAIHRAAGPLLKEECAELKGCPTGQSKITGGYKLPAKYVIHTVGPRGEKPDLLKSCYKTSLQLLLEDELTSIAFPCISTGIYGYPQDAAANVALQTVREILEENKSKITKLIFVVFLDTDVEIYEKLMQIYFPLE